VRPAAQAATAATAARSDGTGSAPAGSTPTGVPSDLASSAEPAGAPTARAGTGIEQPTGTRVASPAAAASQAGSSRAANNVKRTVPKERVRLDKETVTDEATVSEEVRKERIEPEGDAEGRV
jgi:Domain of unknown function (DUF2382)